MIQALIQRVQSYADALWAGFTKTAQDGRKIIYPWGALGRSYIIATEEDERRLKHLFAVYLFVVTILMGVGFALAEYFGLTGTAALVLVCYAVYVNRLTARMEPSDEKLPLVEAYRAQACGHSPRRLWSWTFTGILLVCLGIFSSIAVPENRYGVAIPYLFLIGIGIFCAAFGGWMLLLRRGAKPAAVVPPPPEKSVVAEEAVFYITGDIGPIRAWLIAIFSLVFTGVGVFLFVIDPAERATATGMIAVCGTIAAWSIAMLVLRYRERHG